MSNASEVPEHIRLAAERQGLGKALRLFPEGVVAAYERGTRPLGDLPKSNSPIAQPAPVFKAARFERGE